MVISIFCENNRPLSPPKITSTVHLFIAIDENIENMPITNKVLIFVKASLPMRLLLHCIGRIIDFISDQFQNVRTAEDLSVESHQFVTTQSGSMSSN